jgi:hypothetical protein
MGEEFDCYCYFLLQLSKLQYSLHHPTLPNILALVAQQADVNKVDEVKGN